MVSHNLQGNKAVWILDHLHYHYCNGGTLQATVDEFKHEFPFLTTDLLKQLLEDEHSLRSKLIEPLKQGAVIDYAKYILNIRPDVPADEIDTIFADFRALLGVELLSTGENFIKFVEDLRLSRPDTRSKRTLYELIHAEIEKTTLQDAFYLDEIHVDYNTLHFTLTLATNLNGTCFFDPLFVSNLNCNTFNYHPLGLNNSVHFQLYLQRINCQLKSQDRTILLILHNNVTIDFSQFSNIKPYYISRSVDKYYRKLESSILFPCDYGLTMWIKTLLLRKLSSISTNNPQFIIKSVLNVYYDCIQKLKSDQEKILFNKKNIKISRFLPPFYSRQLAKSSNIVHEDYRFHFADVPIIPGLETIVNYNISVRDVYYTVCCFDRFPLAKPLVHETSAEEITDFFITKLIPFVARSDDAFCSATDSLLNAFMMIFGKKAPLIMDRRKEFGIYDKSHMEGVKKLIDDETRILKKTKFRQVWNNLLSNLLCPSGILEVKELKLPSILEPNLTTTETKASIGTLAPSCTSKTLLETPQTRTQKQDIQTHLTEMQSDDEQSDSNESSSSLLETSSDLNDESCSSLLEGPRDLNNDSNASLLKMNRNSKDNDVQIKDEFDRKPINSSMLELEELELEELESDEDEEMHHDSENSFHGSSIELNHRKRKRSDNKSKKIKKSKIMEILKLNKLDFVTSVDNSVFSEESEESGMDSLVLKVVRQNQTDSRKSSDLQSIHQSNENDSSSSENESEDNLDQPGMDNNMPSTTSFKGMHNGEPSPSDSDFDPVSESDIESDDMSVGPINPNNTIKKQQKKQATTKNTTEKLGPDMIKKPIQNTNFKDENSSPIPTDLTQGFRGNGTPTLKESQDNVLNKKPEDQSHSENTQRQVSGILESTNGTIEKNEQNNLTNGQEKQTGFALDKNATKPNPNLTKRTLAGLAIVFSGKKELTLSEVDGWVRSNVKYFGNLRASWTKSLEKTLNKNDHFECKTNDDGKVTYSLNPEFEENYVELKERLVFGPKRTRAPKDMNRPPYPYNVLIGSAMLMKNIETISKREAEEWIMNTFEYYRNHNKWKHNLANGLNNRFIRVFEFGKRKPAWRMKPEHRLEFAKSKEFNEIKEICKMKMLNSNAAKEVELENIEDNRETMSKISEIWMRKLNSLAFKCDPPFHLDVLTGIAILLSPKRKLKLNQVINWISTVFTFYNGEEIGWQDSVEKVLNETVDIFGKETIEGDVYYYIKPKHVEGFMRAIREVENSENLYPKMRIKDLPKTEHKKSSKLMEKQAPSPTEQSDGTSKMKTTKISKTLNKKDRMEMDDELESEAFISANDKLLDDNNKVDNGVRMLKKSARTETHSSTRKLSTNREHQFLNGAIGTDNNEEDIANSNKDTAAILDSSALESSSSDSESENSADSSGSEDSPESQKSVEPSQIKLLSRVPKAKSTTQHNSNREDGKPTSESDKSLATPMTVKRTNSHPNGIFRTPMTPRSFIISKSSTKPKRNWTTNFSSTERRSSVSQMPTTPNGNSIDTLESNKKPLSPKNTVISEPPTTSKSDKRLKSPETSHNGSLSKGKIVKENNSITETPAAVKPENPSSTVSTKSMTPKVAKSPTTKKTTPKSIKSTKPASAVSKTTDNNKLPVIKVEAARSPAKTSPISKKTNDKIAKLTTTGKPNLLNTRLISRLDDVKQPQTTIETKNSHPVKQSYKPLKMFTDGVSSDDFESSEELTSSEDSDSELSGNDSDKPISKFKK